jgi:hypothetical protein
MDPGRGVRSASDAGVRVRGVVRPLDLVVTCVVGFWPDPSGSGARTPSASAVWWLSSLTRSDLH